MGTLFLVSLVDAEDPRYWSDAGENRHFRISNDDLLSIFILLTGFKQDQELLADDERIVALVRRGTDEIHRDRNFLKSGMGDIKRHTMSNVDRLTRFIHTSDSNVASLKTGQQSILAGQQSILAGQELLSGQIHDLAILPEMINEVFVAESMERQKFAEVLAADSSERRMFVRN